MLCGQLVLCCLKIGSLAFKLRHFFLQGGFLFFKLLPHLLDLVYLILELINQSLIVLGNSAEHFKTVEEARQIR